MMETFERHHVSFVSITQQFNTSTPMGRLMLNVLLSFAQFEREIISERTRDKIAATRRKGKWSGGMPLLGYDVVETKLVVNAVEAERVRQIFALYLELQGADSPWSRNSTAGAGRPSNGPPASGSRRGGRPFTKNGLYQLLTNVTYIGKVRYKSEVHDGEHEAIVTEEVFQKAQSLLHRNGHSGGATVRNKHGALLAGILQCSSCDCPMRHTFTRERPTPLPLLCLRPGPRAGLAVLPRAVAPGRRDRAFRGRADQVHRPGSGVGAGDGRRGTSAGRRVCRTPCVATRGTRTPVAARRRPDEAARRVWEVSAGRHDAIG